MTMAMEMEMKMEMEMVTKITMKTMAKMPTTEMTVWFLLGEINTQKSDTMQDAAQRASTKNF